MLAVHTCSQTHTSDTRNFPELSYQQEVKKSQHDVKRVLFFGGLNENARALPYAEQERRRRNDLRVRVVM